MKQIEKITFDDLNLLKINEKPDINDFDLQKIPLDTILYNQTKILP